MCVGVSSNSGNDELSSGTDDNSESDESNQANSSLFEKGAGACICFGVLLSCRGDTVNFWFIFGLRSNRRRRRERGDRKNTGCTGRFSWVAAEFCLRNG